MKRAIRMLLRVVAAGGIVIGGMNVGLEFVRHRMKHTEINWLHCAINTVIVAAGIILLAGSSKLAERLAENFED